MHCCIGAPRATTCYGTGDKKINNTKKEVLGYLLISNSNNPNKHIVHDMLHRLHYTDSHTIMEQITKWEESRFELPGAASFLPIQRVYSKFATAHMTGEYIVVSPIPPRVYI